jgi:hypothetical protein
MRTSKNENLRLNGILFNNKERMNATKSRRRTDENLKAVLTEFNGDKTRAVVEIEGTNISHLTLHENQFVRRVDRRMIE